jgi:uncharacterized protein (DUF2164 family)
MQITKDSILRKTHYGLNIYAYVLRMYYPDKTVPSLSGRECELTQNPFNNDKQTLSINIHDNLANHFDTEIEYFKGNVFDFANLYFKSDSEKDLFIAIHDALHLNLVKEDKEKEEELAWLDEPDDTWYAHCSFFKAPVRNVFPLNVLKLHEIHSLITSNTYKSVTERLRSFSDIKEKRKFKANNFDYATFSGIFKKRSDKELLKHSSLITIDFDHLENIQLVKEQLLQDAYFETEMLFTSPSGDGIKWIIKIDLSKATHQDYFKAIANYLQQTYNLEVDQSGKDVSRACFLSYDPDAFLHKRHKNND